MLVARTLWRQHFPGLLCGAGRNTHKWVLQAELGNRSEYTEWYSNLLFLANRVHVVCPTGSRSKSFPVVRVRSYTRMDRIQVDRLVALLLPHVFCSIFSLKLVQISKHARGCKLGTQVRASWWRLLCEHWLLVVLAFTCTSHFLMK